ncbi:MAG: hypothetical protein Q6370_012365 [Candidatus Sigynarchaeota archaeon]
MDILDLGIQRIRSQAGMYYLRIAKKLVDSGAIPLDAEYHVKVIVSKKEIIIEKKAPGVPA